MTFDFSWEYVSSENWFRVFSFPILPWAKPFLPLLGLPELLLEHKAVWESIYTDVFSDYQIQDQAKDWAAIQQEGRGELRYQAVMNMLRQLAARLGSEVAVDLEQWVWFHCFCPEAERAMNAWESALRCLYIPADSRQGLNKVEPPPSLVPFIPTIYEFVNLSCRQIIYQEIEQVAPLPVEEQSPYTKLEKCYESILLSTCIDQALTAKVLQRIAQNLNELERLEVAEWAEIQIQTRHPKFGHPEYLCGDKYLKPKLFCSEAPSLLL